MKLRPIQDKIVVEREKAKDKSEGGIIIPDPAKEKPKQGKVVAIGPGKRIVIGETTETWVPDVKKGDTVLFGAYAGQDVKIDKKEFVVLTEEDIFGVLEE